VLNYNQFDLTLLVRKKPTVFLYCSILISSFNNLIIILGKYMEKIADLNLYVGTKEEYHTAIEQNMDIVCALNRAKGYVTHQSIVGWSGRGCNKDNPYYLKRRMTLFI
jgi:hypothetical protein